MACKSVFIINGQVFELALDSSQTPESSFNVEDLALAFTLEDNKEKISEIQEALKVELNSIEKKASKKINPEKELASTHNTLQFNREFGTNIQTDAQILVIDSFKSHTNMVTGKYILPSGHELFVINPRQVKKLELYLNTRDQLRKYKRSEDTLDKKVIKDLKNFIKSPELKKAKYDSVYDLLLYVLDNPNAYNDLIVDDYNVGDYVNNLIQEIKYDTQKKSFNNKLLTELYRKSKITKFRDNINFNRRILSLESLKTTLYTRLNQNTDKIIDIHSATSIIELNKILEDNIDLVKERLSSVVDFNQYSGGSVLEYIFNSFNDPEFNYRFESTYDSIILRKHQTTIQEKFGLNFDTITAFQFKEKYRSYNIFVYNDNGKRYYKISKYTFLNPDENATTYTSLPKAKAAINEFENNSVIARNSFMDIHFKMGNNFEVSTIQNFSVNKVIPVLNIKLNNVQHDFNINGKLKDFYTQIETKYPKQANAIKEVVDTTEKALIFIYKVTELAESENPVEETLKIIREAEYKYYYIKDEQYSKQNNIYTLSATDNNLFTQYKKSTKPFGQQFSAIQAFFANLGVKVNFVNSLDTLEFVAEIKNNAKAFIRDGQIYINTSIASPSDLVHEYTHLLLGVLRANNIELYEKLVNIPESMSKTTKEKIKRLYPNLSNTDLNEEVFVSMFSDYIQQRLPNGFQNIFAELETPTRKIFDNFKGDINELYSTDIDTAFTQFCSEVREIVSRSRTSLKGFLSETIQERRITNFISKSLGKTIEETCK